MKVDLDKKILKEMALHEIQLAILVVKWFKYMGKSGDSFRDENKPKGAIVQFLRKKRIVNFYNNTHRSLILKYFT